MAQEWIYLDYNATAVPRPEAVAAATAALRETGNPSSVHKAGRRAAAMLALARDQVAALAGVAARNVIFTSGATEANNMVLQRAAASHLVISAIEHDSVREPARRSGKPVTTVGVDANGRVDLAALEAALIAGEAALVSVMAANNETGVIQPLDEIGRLVHAHGARLHCDAVQAAGRIDLMAIAEAADFVSLSAHKIGGPAGVGALIARGGSLPAALLAGGGQELGLRAGSENLSGIAGFGAAAEAAARDATGMARLVELRDALEAELLASSPDIVIAGQGAPRIGNTSCIVMPGLAAETQVMAFDLAGIAVSAGAACSSGKIRRSHVLDAMGFDARLAGAAIRVSMGWATVESDIAGFIAVWRSIYENARAGALLAEAQ